MSLNYKLVKAASGLGLNYSEIKDLLRISTETPIASWIFNKETKETQILVNPQVLKFPLYQIRLILRHEILHYAGYYESEGIENHDLMNIMMDVAINRILHLAYPGEWEKLAERIYPEESRKGILALAQPSRMKAPRAKKATGTIDRQKLKPKIRKAHEEIWDSAEVPSPISLYYRFLFDETKKARKRNPFGSQNGQGSSGEKSKPRDKTGRGAKTSGKVPARKISENIGDKEKEAPTKTPEKVLFREIPEDIKDTERKKRLNQARGQIKKIKHEATFSRGYWQDAKAFSDMVSKLFQKTLVKTKSGMDIKQVSDFINRLNIRRDLEEALDPLMTEASASSRRQLYPFRLSRLGTIYAACGISDLIPFFWNQTPESQKLSVAVYVDTSPSMNWAKEYEVFLIDKLKEVFPAKIIVFSGSVQEISTKEFAQGIYPAGYSTSFNAVVENFLERKDDFALVFTDGQSSISWNNQQRIKESKKRLFALYFDSHNSDISSDFDNIAVKTMTLKLPRRLK